MSRAMMVAVLEVTPKDYKSSTERTPTVVAASDLYEVEPDAFGLFGAFGDFVSASRVTYWDQRRHQHIEGLRANNTLQYTPYPGFLIGVPDGKRLRVKDDLNSAWTTTDTLRAGTVDHANATSRWFAEMIERYPRALDMMRAVKRLSAGSPDAVVVLSWS